MIFVVDDSGQREEFGTDRQAGSLNRIHVDCETHSFIFDKELNTAPALRKILALPDQERTRLLHTVQYFWQMLFFSLTHENKLTCLQLRKFIDPAGQKLATIDVLSPDDFIECATKRVVSKYADSNWSFFTLKNS